MEEEQTIKQVEETPQSPSPETEVIELKTKGKKPRTQKQIESWNKALETRKQKVEERKNMKQIEKTQLRRKKKVEEIAPIVEETINPKIKELEQKLSLYESKFEQLTKPQPVTVVEEKPKRVRKPTKPKPKPVEVEDEPLPPPAPMQRETSMYDFMFNY